MIEGQKGAMIEGQRGTMIEGQKGARRLKDVWEA
jgi:hypothetical protein